MSTSSTPQNTSLFLPRTTGGGVKRAEIICSAPYQQGPYDPERKFVFHPVWKEDVVAAPGVPDHEECCCWYDTYPIEPGKPVFHMPASYGGVAEWGDFCSIACMKSWMREHSCFNTPVLLTAVTQMAREKYGMHGPLRMALPVSRLKRFRGDLDIVTWRNWGKNGEVECIVHQQPFITWAIAYEERRTRAQPVPTANATASSTPVMAPVPPPTAITLPAFPERSRADREPVQIRGLRASTAENQGQLQSAHQLQFNEIMDAFQPLPAQWDTFVQQQRNAPPPPPEKKVPEKSTGSAMKGPATKRQKTHHTAAQNNAAAATTTTSAKVEVTVSARPVATDGARGSLRAFMRQRVG